MGPRPISEMAEALVTERGALVSSGDCSTIEIADARLHGRLFVREDGIGFVLRMKEWLVKAEKAISEQDGDTASLQTAKAVSEPVKHTPGPWVQYDRFYIGTGSRTGSLASVTACMDVPADRLDEHDANARLIAAAPEMLAALEAVKAFGSHSSTDDGVSTDYLVELALKKARG